MNQKVISATTSALLAIFSTVSITACAQNAVATQSAAQLMAAHAKNWTAPAYRMYAQKLVDDIIARNPALISVTLQGVPPSFDKTYTMFAGSFPDRIGNSSDPDDVEVITKGITILDPRYKRADPEKKFVVLTPLRDATGENIGLMVIAYKNHGTYVKSDRAFYDMSQALRDATQSQIPSFKALFEPAK